MVITTYPPVGNFTEEPQNTTCVLGQDFSVRCRPPGYSATARWLFGGERLFITHPPPGVSPTSRGNLFELQITCIPERHYVTVQCIAVIDIGVEEEGGPPAFIRVEGEARHALVARECLARPYIWPVRLANLIVVSRCPSMGKPVSYTVLARYSNTGASCNILI